MSNRSNVSGGLNGTTFMPVEGRSAWDHGICVRFRTLHPVEVPHEADHAVVAGCCRLEVEAGFTNQREVAVEGAQRDAESASVVRDGHRFAASKNRREPDDADERKSNAAAVGVGKLSAAAWWGFRRKRVESGGCHSVGLSIG